MGNGTVGVQGNVANMDDLENLYKTTAEKFGKIDVLVVNAGGGTIAPIDQVDEASFDEMSNTNFKGAFFTVQKALPHLNDGASIVLVASIAAKKGFPAFSVYSATKAAVRSLARTLTADLLPRGIRVNVISPGPVDTPIMHRTGLPEEKVEEMKEGFVQMVPMKRVGTTSEIAKAALFLATSDSSFIAGEELTVDGGLANL